MREDDGGRGDEKTSEMRGRHRVEATEEPLMQPLRRGRSSWCVPRGAECFSGAHLHVASWRAPRQRRGSSAGAHLAGNRRVQALGQEHGVRELVVGERLVDALGQEPFQVAVVAVHQHIFKTPAVFV